MSDLHSHIKNSCIEYIAATEIGGRSADILFAGNFLGQNVVWQATITVHEGRQYIDVSHNPVKSVITVCIGLNVDRISDSVIQKSIKMVQQYRNLRFGKHEFDGKNK